ncbi:hypothetical protein BST61_g2935 [Cercospora zeina]
MLSFDPLGDIRRFGKVYREPCMRRLVNAGALKNFEKATVHLEGVSGGRGLEQDVSVDSNAMTGWFLRTESMKVLVMELRKAHEEIVPVRCLLTKN